MAIDLTTAQTMLDTWLDAEKAVATSQSYRVGNQSLTRANLPDIRKQIIYWNDQVERLTNSRSTGARVLRAIPRDF